MFTGWMTNTMDAKGRLAIPARFRDVLARRGDERLVVTASDKCLVAYPIEEWSALVEKVANLSQFNLKVQAFRRYFISSGTEYSLDRQGRILIPPSLRESAGLTGQVQLVGMQSNFEIWDKDRWIQERERIRQDFGDLSTVMAELGL
ncbi:MAG: division/cell wall cluster transcriptional repressor MraZ [Desulfarculus sp.]|nr:division/cell wall cluster transcriptional repressor MraZ [Desulfarculus sp.]